MTITIYDVAKEAKVSMATVSRVVNNNPNVKEDTRLRVQEVIKKLRYTPNAVARGLASKKTTTIGIVLPDIADLSSAEIVSGIESVANMYKYNIILANSCDDQEIEKNIFASFVSKQVDGIIYLGHSLSDSSKNYLQDIQIPVVLAGNLGTDSEFYSVNIDYEKAAYDVTKEFLAKGVKNISLIIDKYESQKTQRLIKGYKDALASEKVDFKPQNIIDGTYKESNKLYKAVSNIDAEVVITMFDEVALATMQQALDLGMSIPGDLQILSLENTKLINMTRPKISSVFQPIFDIGAVSMRVLTKIIDIEKAKRKGEEIDAEELAELKAQEKEMNLPYRIVHRQTTK